MENSMSENIPSDSVTSPAHFRLRGVLRWLKFSLPVLCLAVYPVIFLYSSNAQNLKLSNLALQLALYAGIALLVYMITSLVFRTQPLKAANAAFIFLVFFNFYGLLYAFLLKLDIFRVEHYRLLPLYLLLALYASWLISKLRPLSANFFWKAGIVLFGALSLFNLIRIVPAEISKFKLQSKLSAQKTEAQTGGAAHSPDIYYIIFDEFVGFQPMRDYWHNSANVDPFVAYLKSKGFLVAENSYASTTNTLHQMAIRFNYQDYPLDDPNYQQTWFNAIASNKAMQYLKNKGYTTIVFDETSMGYPSAPPILADVSYTYGQVPATRQDGLFGDFGILIADNTLLRVFSKNLLSSTYAGHINFINLTVNKIAEHGEVDAPCFVHVHLLLPHAPFMFDKNGNITDPSGYSNWGNYLANYNYSLKVAMKMVSNILAAADPTNPPVIILQSDHGMRNLEDGYNGILENYPPEYKTSILFAILLPGLDAADFPQDINPINTFPLVFDQLFGDNIPLVK